MTIRSLTQQQAKYNAPSKRKAKAKAKAQAKARNQLPSIGDSVPEPVLYEVTPDDNGFVRSEPTKLGKFRAMSERVYTSGKDSKVFSGKAPTKRPECALGFAN